MIAAPGPFFIQVLPPTVLWMQYVTDVGAFGKSSSDYVHCPATMSAPGPSLFQTLPPTVLSTQ